MNPVSNNIKLLRRKHQFTQEQFAEKLGIKRSLLGAYEEARAKPRLEVLVKAASVFNVSVDALVAEDFSRNGVPANAPQAANGKYTPPRPQGQPIILIDKHQQDSYFQNREDQQYLAALPELRLPMMAGQGNAYRAFEIAEEAMPPVVPGTVVVGQRQENLQAIQDGTVCVVITRAEGVLLRQVYNRIARDGTLQLQATHPAYTRTTLPVLGKEAEVWEVAWYLCPQMSFTNASTAPMDIQQLAGMVLELQQEVKQMKRGKD